MIRVATKEDIPVIKRLANEIWWPTYGPILSEDQIRFMLATIYNEQALGQQLEEGAVFIICTDGGHDCGFASFSSLGANSGIYKLHKLYLHPQVQGKGLGRMLIAKAEELAMAAGAEVMELNVNRFNPAKDFYLRYGYIIDREEDIPFYGYFMNDYVLRRNLVVSS